MKKQLRLRKLLRDKYSSSTLELIDDYACGIINSFELACAIGSSGMELVDEYVQALYQEIEPAVKIAV